MRPRYPDDNSLRGEGRQPPDRPPLSRHPSVLRRQRQHPDPGRARGGSLDRDARRPGADRDGMDPRCRSRVHRRWPGPRAGHGRAGARAARRAVARPGEWRSCVARRLRRISESRDVTANARRAGPRRSGRVSGLDRGVRWRPAAGGSHRRRDEPRPAHARRSITGDPSSFAPRQVGAKARTGLGSIPWSGSRTIVVGRPWCPAPGPSRWSSSGMATTTSMGPRGCACCPARAEPRGCGSAPTCMVHCCRATLTWQTC